MLTKHRHQVHWRAGAEERAGDAQDEKLRPQIAQRDQRDPARDGARAGHESGPLSAARRNRRAPARSAERNCVTMRHLKSGRQLSRNSSHRWALMRNLVTALLRNEKIQTTDAKAKELRRWADRVITLGKQGSLHARRQALSIVQDKAVVRKLFDTLAPRFKDRPGGYTRIIKLGIRRGDAAQMSLIELVGAEGEKEARKTGEKKGRRARRRQRQQEAAA